MYKHCDHDQIFMTLTLYRWWPCSSCQGQG